VKIEKGKTFNCRREEKRKSTILQTLTESRLRTCQMKQTQSHTLHPDVRIAIFAPNHLPQAAPEPRATTPRTHLQRPATPESAQILDWSTPPPSFPASLVPEFPQIPTSTSALLIRDLPPLVVVRTEPCCLVSGSSWELRQPPRGSAGISRVSVAPVPRSLQFAVRAPRSGAPRPVLRARALIAAGRSSCAAPAWAPALPCLPDTCCQLWYSAFYAYLGTGLGWIC
jgi:hypothetical protein